MEPASDPKGDKRIGLARAINKAGYTSRSLAEKLVLDGAVRLNGSVVRDPDKSTTASDLIEIAGKPLVSVGRIYLMCNKPRGLVTTAEDERGRDTVFQCLEGLGLPHVGPVGRLDMASEGLLLFTNDTGWSNALLDPANRISKTYHVQVDGLVDQATADMMMEGIVDRGDFLRASSVTLLRQGERNCWLEVVLQEGKNREIRRMLKAFGFEVLRLIRIGFASLQLGDLPKGSVRPLTASELEGLRKQLP